MIPRVFIPMLVAVLVPATGLGQATALPSPGLRAAAPSMFLVNDERVPHLAVSWATNGGEVVRYEADLPYAAPAERVPIGGNLRAFVAVGGTRLDKGVGHPDGIIIRVGFDKADEQRLMFLDIAHGSFIEVELRNLAFISPGLPRPDSLLQHLQYRTDDILACGLPTDQADMYNLASLTDDLGGSIAPTRGRFGALNGSSGADAESRLVVEPDGSVTMRLRFAYRLLRHQSDPWRLELPGTFFEPSHFHVEFEAVPQAVGITQFGLSAPR